MTSQSAPDPMIEALFLTLGFLISGTVQVIWLASPGSLPMAVPIDRGRTFRGRRLLGDNKMLRGFVVIVPATAASFALLSIVFERLGIHHLIWSLTTSAYALLGAVAAVGFMLGELPNSFLKRQLDIPSGGLAPNLRFRLLFRTIDRIDSILGMLIVVTLAIPTSWQVWAWLLVIGPGIHLFFSSLLFLAGTKERPA